MKNLEQYVGREVKGVVFERTSCDRVGYSPKMDAHIGHRGVITWYDELGDYFEVSFETPVKASWNYPARVILPQLEGEPVGYTINDEKYAKIIAGLAGISINTLLKLSDKKVHFDSDSFVYKKVKEYDLLDKCTPVYRQKEIKLPVIKGYNGEDKGDYIQYGCAQLLKSWFEKSENRSISSLELSSGVRIDIEEMDAIREYLKSKEKNLIP